MIDTCSVCVLIGIFKLSSTWEAVWCTMSIDSEWMEVISLLSARVSLLEGRFRKGKAESATSFVQGREEGAHNGRWQGKDADFIDSILNYLAEYYPLEPLIGEEPQDTPWFVINEFKKCALDTTSIKTHLLEKLYHDLSFCYGQLDYIDKALHVNSTSNLSIDDTTNHKKGIRMLLNNVQVCTYIANITHDERKVIHIMTTQNDKYIRIFNIVFFTLKKHKYSVEWIESITNSGIQVYGREQGD